MKRTLNLSLLILLVVCASSDFRAVRAMGDDFNDVVKTIEEFYHVKHKGIPFLAKAGIKTATTVAKIAGGRKRQLAEAGSVRVAYFEDQEFDARGRNFQNSIDAVLAQDWTPLVQVLAPKEQSQTYVFVRSVGEKFKVLVVNLEPRDGSVVQVTLAPQTLAMLLQEPNEMGNAITVDATTNDNE
ncbi:MAG TPA: hypothetical protein VJU86_21730 [Pyrinomonadaceae bacterium]|nr:hypothetical protein [Pyrinomonadaceae bacterium]